MRPKINNLYIEDNTSEKSHTNNSIIGIQFLHTLPSNAFFFNVLFLGTSGNFVDL